MDVHLYMLCYRTEALVASQLDPEAFGRYMATGTQKNTKGNVIFFEIDPSLQSSYFRLSDVKARCVPHVDGAPKASKYLSIYRVLEHLPLSVFGKLYLTTADGRVLGLEASPYDALHEAPAMNLYAELCPTTPIVVSVLDPAAFVRVMTDPAGPISVPRIFFADMVLDLDKSGRLAGYLPYPDPEHIMDCIRELERERGKPTKTIARVGWTQGFYRTIRRGFYLGDQSGLRFYRFPEVKELEINHSYWWKSASESLML